MIVIALKENLKALRKKKGLTQHELAAASGLSYSTISKLECGEKKHPSQDTLEKIADALDITVSEIMRGVNIFEQFDIVMKDTLEDITLYQNSPQEYVHRQLHALLISPQATDFFSINQNAISPDELENIEKDICEYIKFKFSQFQGKPSIYEK